MSSNDIDRPDPTVHDQDCDGQCGWSRTLCDEQWRAFSAWLRLDALERVQNDDDDMSV